MPQNLIARCIEDDPAAWAVFWPIFDRATRRVYSRVLPLFIKHSSDVNELQNEFLVRLKGDPHAILGRFRGTTFAELSAFLCRCARYDAVNRLKALHRKDLREMDAWQSHGCYGALGSDLSEQQVRFIIAELRPTLSEEQRQQLHESLTAPDAFASDSQRTRHRKIQALMQVITGWGTIVRLD